MSFKVCDHELSLEISRLSKGLSCLARHGSTTILCSVFIGDWEGFGSFLPMTVNYFERSYAINKIPGGFIKREGRQRENEILISRLIDRAIRPTIEQSFRFRITISCITLSYSKHCPIEPLAITAASAALYAAGVPCSPVAATSLNYSGGRWSFGTGDTTMHIAGNHYGVSTVELSGSPLTVDQVIDGTNFASTQLGSIIDFVRHKLTKFKRLSHSPVPIETKSVSIDGRAIIESYTRGDSHAVSKHEADFISKWEDKAIAKFRWMQMLRATLRSHIMWTSKRLDSRGLDEVRHITAAKEVLPLHGSCLFSRGKTQVLCIVTVSNGNESQVFESLDINDNRKFILHYNYIAEDRNGSPSRRDMGHGNLARNALKFGINSDKFIRVVSEVIDSDGSSSMATVCGAYIALRNAGIEMPDLVGGVSVGVIIDGFAHKFIADMSELEDMVSDMDLKVAGTRKGFTALQIDLKIPFLPWNIFTSGLQYAFGQLTEVISIVGTYTNEHRNEPRHHKQPSSSAPAKPDVVTPAKPEVPKVSSEDSKPNSEPRSDTPRQVVIIKLAEEQIKQIVDSAVIEEVKRDMQANVSIRNNSVKFYGKNVPNAINRVLTVGYKAPKPLYYAKVVKLDADFVEVELLTGRKCRVARDPAADVSEGKAVAIYKGRFGKWTFHSTLGG